MIPFVFQLQGVPAFPLAGDYGVGNGGRVQQKGVSQGVTGAAGLAFHQRGAGVLGGFGGFVRRTGPGQLAIQPQRLFPVVFQGSGVHFLHPGLSRFLGRFVPGGHVQKIGSIGRLSARRVLYQRHGKAIAGLRREKRLFAGIGRAGMGKAETAFAAGAGIKEALDFIRGAAAGNAMGNRRLVPLQGHARAGFRQIFSLRKQQCALAWPVHGGGGAVNGVVFRGNRFRRGSFHRVGQGSFRRGSGRFRNSRALGGLSGFLRQGRFRRRRGFRRGGLFRGNGFFHGGGVLRRGGFFRPAGRRQRRQQKRGAQGQG